MPRKTDMERKIEIVQFASRTRQLFIRLLALVKWAASASKVEKCAVSMIDLTKFCISVKKVLFYILVNFLNVIFSLNIVYYG